MYRSFSSEMSIIIPFSSSFREHESFDSLGLYIIIGKVDKLDNNTVMPDNERGEYLWKTQIFDPKE